MKKLIATLGFAAMLVTCPTLVSANEAEAAAQAPEQNLELAKEEAGAKDKAHSKAEKKHHAKKHDKKHHDKKHHAKKHNDKKHADATKAEEKHDAKPEAKHDAKPEAKHDAKPEAKHDAKPEAKHDAKPEAADKKEAAPAAH